MSLNISGEKCSVCKAYLFDEDDVVYCPVCGAPHHRDCYNSLGHCGLEEFHGTDRQYQKPQPEQKSEEQQPQKEKINDGEILCSMCGAVYSRESDACPKCGAPNVSKMGGRFVTFDFLGGVPSDMDLGNEVTADEATMFVASNTQRYIPKFAQFKIGKKASWNWAAFLFPCAWFASRKMYAKSVIIGVLQIVFTMFLLPFNNAISVLDFTDAKNYIEMSQIIMQNMSSVSTAAVALAFIGVLLALVIRFVCAIIGDYTYGKRVINEVADIKLNSDDKILSYRKRGGVSLTAALIGIMAVEYLPTIFAALIGVL